ncbi:hypothetical protein GQ600_8534 [Phytophthora cactorum]|nr:hypothetical protein GQ600_8534 [Phytophthora cactorum]
MRPFMPPVGKRSVFFMRLSLCVEETLISSLDFMETDACVVNSSSATSESTTNSKHVGDQERTRGFRCLEQMRRAQLNLTVYLDATYAIDQARGPICGGVGDLPTGTACPYKGDIATADCNSTLPSYNGTDCVAPVDGECVVDAESKWSCVFPNNSDGSKEAEDLSSTLTVSSESSMESPWATFRGEHHRH